MAPYSAIITSAEVTIAGGQIFKIAASRFVNVSEEEISNDPGKKCTIFYCSAAISFPHIETVVFSDQEFIN